MFSQLNLLYINLFSAKHLFVCLHFTLRCLPTETPVLYAATETKSLLQIHLDFCLYAFDPLFSHYYLEKITVYWSK